LPSSTKKLKEIRALIDSNLSPVKNSKLPDDDFRLKMQPINSDIEELVKQYQVEPADPEPE
jgi:hypothetical protein